jgi:hypothetical protein
MLQPINYDYRPASYWAPQNVRQVVANIKGAERKKTALRLIDEARLDEAHAVILADTLSGRERELAGKADPSLMGGEYLPDYCACEAEIARVTMASLTQDVISIRAYPRHGRIGYRAVDEYKSQIRVKPGQSKRPLSLRQLIRLIDTGESDELGPIGLCIIQIQFDCTEEPAESFASFVEFSSEFYPDLTRHYRFKTRWWVEQNRKRRAAR